MATTDYIVFAAKHLDSVRSRISKLRAQWADHAAHLAKSDDSWGGAGEAGAFREFSGTPFVAVFDRYESGTDYGCCTLTESGRLDDILDELDIPYGIREAEYESRPPYGLAVNAANYASRARSRAIEQSVPGGK